MARELRSLFSDMADVNRANLESTFRPARFSKFTDEIRSNLKSNYRKTSKAFKNNLRNRMGLRGAENAAIDAEIVRHIDNQSRTQARRILKTTDREAALALRKSFEASTNEEDIIRGADREFRRRNRIRSKIIAQTEIQNSAENSKFTEAKVLRDKKIVKDVRKTWRAVLDQRVRNDHAVMDGQRIDIDGTFVVGGSRMRHPGDTSFGADASQTINCRCTVFYNARRV
jgi:hypothetical protein